MNWPTKYIHTDVNRIGCVEHTKIKLDSCFRGNDKRTIQSQSGAIFRTLPSPKELSNLIRHDVICNCFNRMMLV